MGKRVSLILSLLICLGLLVPGCGLFFQAEIAVHFINVGDGDSIVVNDWMTNKAVLIDGGKIRTISSVPFYLKELAVIPQEYDSEGNEYWVLEAMISTNPEPEYVEGLIAVLNDPQIKVRDFYYSGHAAYAENEDLQTALANAGLKPQVLTSGDTLKIGGLKFEVLHPGQDPDSYAEVYDASLVLRLDYGDNSILFASAIGTEAEEEMLAADVTLAADFLKMSMNWEPVDSSEFIKAVNPLGLIFSQEEEPEELSNKARKSAQKGAKSYWTNPDPEFGHSIAIWLNKVAFRVDAPQEPFEFDF